MRKILANPLVYKTVQKLFGSEGLRKTLSAEYLTLKNNDDLLDLGCGTGDILKFLPSINYTGIDSSEEYVKNATKLINNEFGPYTRFPSDKYKALISHYL